MQRRDAHVASSDEDERGELEQRHGSRSSATSVKAGGGADRDLPESHSLTGGEVERVRKRIKLRALAVYVIIKEEGEDELLRPTRSLIWSGATAGVAMGFSVLTLALLQQKLPEALWRDLVASLGYSVGFLLVILGRQQLFTESTITAVLPFTSHPELKTLVNLLRVWSAVLLSNLAGCVLVAFAFLKLGLVPSDVADAMLAVSKHLMPLSPGEAFRHGIGAGFLIAALVWMMPSAEGGEVFLIVITAWLIALGGFSNVIAGAVETALLVLDGQIGAIPALTGITLPVLAGNVVGGTALFALLSYAQVKQELEGGVPPQM